MSKNCSELSLVDESLFEPWDTDDMEQSLPASKKVGLQRFINGRSRPLQYIQNRGIEYWHQGCGSGYKSALNLHAVKVPDMKLIIWDPDPDQDP